MKWVYPYVFVSALGSYEMGRHISIIIILSCSLILFSLAAFTPCTKLPICRRLLLSSYSDCMSGNCTTQSNSRTRDTNSPCGTEYSMSWKLRSWTGFRTTLCQCPPTLGRKFLFFGGVGWGWGEYRLKGNDSAAAYKAISIVGKWCSDTTQQYNNTVQCKPTWLPRACNHCRRISNQQTDPHVTDKLTNQGQHKNWTTVHSRLSANVDVRKKSEKKKISNTRPKFRIPKSKTTIAINNRSYLQQVCSS